MTAQDIANLMDELAARKKFRKALFIADTCQAFTLFDKLTTPNVYALGTSLRGENAYAHHSDVELGLSVIERWTHGFMTQYKRRPFHPVTTTLHDLMVQPFEGKTPLGAHVGVLGNFRDLLLHEFFGSPSRAKSPNTNQKVSQQRPVLPLPKQSITAVVSPPTENVISLTTETCTSSDTTKSEEESPNSQKDESSTLSHQFEPTDLSFGLLVGGLIVLVVSASQFGKSIDDDVQEENAHPNEKIS
jgi:glycosylphosphatidylinositol transamidase (GPIT) subunit GPI8